MRSVGERDALGLADGFQELLGLAGDGEKTKVEDHGEATLTELHEGMRGRRWGRLQSERAGRKRQRDGESQEDRKGRADEIFCCCLGRSWGWTATQNSQSKEKQP